MNQPSLPRENRTAPRPREPAWFSNSQDKDTGFAYKGTKNHFTADSRCQQQMTVWAE